MVIWLAGSDTAADVKRASGASAAVQLQRNAVELGRIVTTDAPMMTNALGMGDDMGQGS